MRFDLRYFGGGSNFSSSDSNWDSDGMSRNRGYYVS